MREASEEAVIGRLKEGLKDGGEPFLYQKRHHFTKTDSGQT
jgi:hypothetical protein